MGFSTTLAILQAIKKQREGYQAIATPSIEDGALSEDSYTEPVPTINIGSTGEISKKRKRTSSFLGGIYPETTLL